MTQKMVLGEPANKGAIPVSSDTEVSELLAGVFENSPDGVLILKFFSGQARGPHDYEIVLANAAAEEFFGDGAVLAGQYVMQILPWLGSSKLPEAFEAAKTSNRTVYQEVQYSERYGPVWFDVSVMPHKNCLIIVFRDISVQRKTEARLVDTERRFRDFAFTASAWFWEMDADLRYTWFSPNFEEITQAPREQLLGKTPWQSQQMGQSQQMAESQKEGESAQPGDRYKSWEDYKEYLEARQPFSTFVAEQETFTGARRYYSFSGVPVFDDDNVFRGYRGIASDVSGEILAHKEKKQTKRKAVDAHERLIDALENIRDGFALFDADDRLVMCNKKYFKFYNYLRSPDEIAGRTYEEIMRMGLDRGYIGDPLALSDPDTWLIDNLRHHLDPPEEPLEQKLADGRWLLVGKQRTKDGGLVGLISEITAVKKQTNELSELAEKYSREKERAETANRAKSTFLANMSHELRTPLNAIIGFSEIIRDGLLGPLDDAIYKEYAGDIHISGSHLLDLINDMLDMSKIEAGKWELCPEYFDLRDVIDECVRLFKGRAFEAGLEIEKHIGPLPAACADERATRQVLLNLLSNAIKFTPRGGSVRLSAAADEEGFTIAVRDTGIGIAQADIAKLAIPFSQVNTQATEYKGTGLGLAISKALVEMHGGRIAIDSELDVGTTISFSLPRLPVPPENLQGSRGAARR